MNPRVDRLRRRLDERGLYALLVSQPENRRYLSGFTGSAGHLLITTDFRYYEQAGQQAPGFHLYEATGPMETWLPGLLSGLGGGKLAFESADLTFSVYRTLRKAIDELPQSERPRLVATTNLVEGLRAVKEPEEVAAIQAAVDLGDAAWSRGGPRSRSPGRSRGTFASTAATARPSTR
jgi:Xaa-Pro aminopeptidase